MARFFALGLLLALLAPAVSAQITLTRDTFRSQLDSGTTTTSYDASGSTGLQAIADRSGPNQTWDFSALAFDAPQTSTMTPAGSGVPGADDERLAGATHIVRVVSTDSSAYLFARLTADAFETLGVTAESASGEGFDGILYTPAQRTYALPLTAGSAWMSESDLVFSPTLDGLTIRERVRNVVEGWGTLVTPQGSTPVLKVRTVAVVTVGFGPFPPVSDSTQTITFLSGGAVSASITLDNEGTAYEASYATTTVGTAVGDDAGASSLDLHIAGANPARRGSNVNVAFAMPTSGPAMVEVFDVLGRRVATLADGTLPTDGRTVWQTGTTPAGLYLVRLRAGGRTAMRQVVLTN